MMARGVSFGWPRDLQNTGARTADFFLFTALQYVRAWYHVQAATKYKLVKGKKTPVSATLKPKSMSQHRCTTIVCYQLHPTRHRQHQLIYALHATMINIMRARR